MPSRHAAEQTFESDTSESTRAFDGGDDPPNARRSFPQTAEGGGSMSELLATPRTELCDTREGAYFEIRTEPDLALDVCCRLAA
jgi:hypothetical protein